MCVCVCVCVRERERERESRDVINGANKDGAIERSRQGEEKNCKEDEIRC